jgi:hypothetical protein
MATPPRHARARLTRRPSWLATAALLLGLAACGTAAAQATPSSRLRFFGYAMVDCGVHDGFIPSPATNYVSEVAAFTNIGQMCVFGPGEDIGARLSLMQANGMLALLSVQALLFEGAPDPSTGSGTRHRLRSDFQRRWSSFVRLNRLNGRAAAIGAFYLADEPTWNGISAADLRQAADLVKSTFPTTPIMLIEAAPAIGALVVPRSVDVIGFDQYGVAAPDADPAYLAHLAELKSRRSRPDQRLVVVMEGQWLPAYDGQGVDAGLMATVAQRYFALADSDPEVVAMVGYLWPGGVAGPGHRGSRNLPPAVINEHVRLGKAITRK